MSESYCQDHTMLVQEVGNIRGHVEALVKSGDDNKATLKDIYAKLNDLDRKLTRWEGKIIGAGAAAGAIVSIAVKYLW